MAIVQAASTIDVLHASEAVSGSAVRASDFPITRRNPGAWLVNLTEAAQRLLARGALAQGWSGADTGSDCFLNDAAGGGCRQIEAARSLHRPTDSR